MKGKMILKAKTITSLILIPSLRFERKTKILKSLA